MLCARPFLKIKTQLHRKRTLARLPLILAAPPSATANDEEASTSSSSSSSSSLSASLAQSQSQSWGNNGGNESGSSGSGGGGGGLTTGPLAGLDASEVRALMGAPTLSIQMQLVITTAPTKIASIQLDGTTNQMVKAAHQNAVEFSSTY
jgi:hypothetical protein